MAKKEFIEAAYHTSKQFYHDEIDMKEAKQLLSAKGMNEGSAFINVNVFKHLMNGEKFTRTLTGPTFDYWLAQIYKDFGAERLSPCLNGLLLHIEYMEADRNYRMRLVRSIHKKYSALLEEASQLEYDEEEVIFPEGKEKYRLHRFKERNRKLVALAKDQYKKTNPDLNCQICKFSFSNRYGEIGINFIEEHHVFPISTLKEETPMRIEDLAMVCSNCHRMLHRKRPWLTIDELGKLIKK